MFAIGDTKWPGVSKIIEEIGELQEVLGKVQQTFGKLMGSRGSFQHWSGDLSDALHDELGDVIGAARFVIKWCGLDADRIERRARAKFVLFERWQETEKPVEETP